MEILKEGQMLYMDRAHVTLFAGNTILAPELERQIGSQWDKSGRALPVLQAEAGH